MSPEAWITVGVLVLTVLSLALSRYPQDAIMLGGLTLLLVSPVPGEGGWHFGVISAMDALHGLANEGVVTIAVLFVVAVGVRETGGMSWVAQRLLGRPKSLPAAQARLMLPAAVMSAFMNNTPLVAMLMPVVTDWARKIRLSVSKLMIPLSYASILGGACTLIGTSTNLIVNGWVIGETSEQALGMFEIAWVGLPVAAVGLIFILVSSKWLLPERRAALQQMGDPREYTIEMFVESGGPLVGKTVEAAGLRHLPDVYLVEIDRQDYVVAPVAPQHRLLANDRLVFAGVVESVLDLQKIRGLTPAPDQIFKLRAPRSSRSLIEAVVSNSNPLIGRTIRDGRFRGRYNAAVIAATRNGKRINKKMGDIVLQPGDTLLLEAATDFAEQQRNSRDFFLISKVKGSRPPRHERAWVALSILGAMVIVVTGGWLSMLQASMLAAGLMIITGCCRASAARSSVDWQILLVIAAALGLGKAMQTSGLAEQLGKVIQSAVGDSPHLALAAVYLLTMILASVITAKAAAVLVLPITMVIAETMGVQLRPFIIVVMIAAATAVATPIGYPTNLMVFGPGGYRFKDYLIIGVPLSLIICAITVVLTPMIWSF